ncbi:MAG: NnrS family protein, partial [Verrucomicrobiota bacterium]
MRVTLKDVAKEPFRVFFPAGVIAGIIGVALWPLYFWGITELYPGQIHARIMACGLFGGFIFGFLGTAMPRMLSANPLRVTEVIPLLLLHIAMVISFALGKVFSGDVLFLSALVGFLACLAIRASKRKDTPPPGFVLVGLALLCVMSGAILAVIQNFREVETFWITLQRLLMYQGFVLLPILGIGPFILPRFFGMPNKHDFPEMLVPSKDWTKKALLALTIGIIIVGSFFM